MKRRYQLLLIIAFGIILTIFINSASNKSKTTLVAIGDGLSSGMTPYNVAGSSFNDYLKEDLEKNNDLASFNNEFSYATLTVHELNEFLEKNTLSKYSRKPIKQIIAKADILTIAIGIDELADKSLITNINDEQIDIYLKEVALLLQNIREFYEKDIVFISLYPAYKFNKKDAILVNSKLQSLCGKYNAHFVDILAISLKKEYYLEQNSYYFNYVAHKKIADLLFKMYN